MRRSLLVIVLTLVALVAADRAAAQESKAAATTRKKLHQKLTIAAKEVGIKAFLEDVNNEVEHAIRFKIDNTTGISNNMKISFSGKDVTVEKVLNELSDKYEFGYVVISDVSNNKVDGMVIVRKGKGKERGYEAGKGPKKGATLDRPAVPLQTPPAVQAGTTRVDAVTAVRRVRHAGT